MLERGLCSVLEETNAQGNVVGFSPENLCVNIKAMTSFCRIRNSILLESMVIRDAGRL